MVKNLPANAGDLRRDGFDPGGCLHFTSNPLQCSGLEDPLDRGARPATVLGVAELDSTELT